jgi:hypothetical protein
MFEEVRWRTLRILEGADEHATRWAPHGLQNTILWHAGHAFVVVESCTMQSLGREPAFSDNWFSIFSGRELAPKDVPAESWPVFGSVITELQSQRDRLVERYSSLSESQLDAPAIHKPQRTDRYMILHGFYDEAAHGGETWLLRKLWDVQKPMAAD